MNIVRYRDLVRLEVDTEVFDILYPRALTEGRHRDISGFGDWRTYVASR
jgi:hypothetical protein